jgi:hypothetical protein
MAHMHMKSGLCPHNIMGCEMKDAHNLKDINNHQCEIVAL